MPSTRRALADFAHRLGRPGARPVGDLAAVYDKAHKSGVGEVPAAAPAAKPEAPSLKQPKTRRLLKRSRKQTPARETRVPHTSVGGQAAAGWLATGLSAAGIYGGLEVAALASPWAWAAVASFGLAAFFGVAALGFFTLSARLGLALSDHMDALIDPRDREGRLKRLFAPGEFRAWLKKPVNRAFMKSPAAAGLSPEIARTVRRHEVVRRGRFGRAGAYLDQMFAMRRLLLAEGKLLKGAFGGIGRVAREMALGEPGVAPLLKPYQRDINIARGLLIAKAFLNTAMAFSIGALVDAALAAGAVGSFPVYAWLGALGAMILFKALVRKVYIFYAGRLRVGLRRDFRLHLFGHLLRLPLSFTQDEDPGRLAVRLTQDVGRLTAKNVTIPVQFPHHVIQLALAAGFVVYSSWQLSLLLLTGIPIMALLSWLYGRRAERYSEALMTRQAILTSTGGELLSEARQIGSVGGQEGVHARYRRKADRLETVMMKQIRLSSTYEAVKELLGNFFTDWIVLVLGFVSFLSTGQPSIGQIMALRGYAKDARGSIDGVLGLYTESKASAGATKRVLSYLNEQTIAAEAGAEFAKGPGRIAFEGVRFGGRLRGVDFAIAAGERAAILGGSANARRSLIDLLLRLDHAGAGRVMIDAQNASEVKPASLQKAMALVQEDAMVFEGSVYENLFFGNEREVNVEELKATLKDAGAAFLLDAARFPGGLESEMSPKTLSAAERAHFALARAALREPRILIYDGLGVGFDSRERRVLTEAMNRVAKGRTTLFLNIPVDQIGGLDRVLILRDGRVAADGKPEDVMELDEGFKRLLAGAS